jgi:anthranilate/para-aminobenzoate synthase component I
VESLAPPGRLEAALAVRELRPPRSFPALLEALRARPGAWVLESTLARPPLGRFSFAGGEPWLVLSARGREVDLDVRRAVRPDLAPGRRRLAAHPLEAARALLGPPPGRVPPAAPPFAGGAVGVFGYELGGLLERLPPPPPEDLGLPDVALLFVDRVLAFDGAERRLAACGLGFGASAAEAAARAGAAAAELAARVEPWLDAPGPGEAPSAEARPSLAELDRRAARLAVSAGFDASSYAKTVERILEEILEGNVYQACLTQRLDVPFAGDRFALHARLRETSPAPFAACLELPGAALVSSSPERFLRVEPDGRVESRPIKGTRPRGRDAEEDARLGAELAASEKDRAENLMIVDLVRNDLGRVCATGTVEVPELWLVEGYATVFQLVSTVRGRLRAGCDALDALAASFPPGSMTGAPKIAAMSLLARLEPCRRGFYSGALGWLDVRGGADLSVLIRAAILRAGRAHVHVGGGVVLGSDPAGEHRESLDKARALLAALATA